MAQTIAVVDYGMGNLRSVVKALEHVCAAGDSVLLTSDPQEILTADRILFPGQGAARDCMRALDDTGMGQVVMEVAQTKPFLGICMGMQVLMRHSQENEGVNCLGMYPGEVIRFNDQMNGEKFKIPHMGWNTVHQAKPHPLWNGIDDNSHFYFVHSYHVEPGDASLVAGTTEYGVTFTSAIARDNVFAIQCHPEKSAQAGLKLLENFVQWDI